jgi:hypothetical protein
MKSHINRFKLLMKRVLIFFILFGCKNNINYEWIGEDVVKVTKYVKGDVYEVSMCNKDTIRHGMTIFYFPDGSIKKKLYYEYGEKHGNDSVFYRSGNLKERRQWNMGNPVYDLSKYYDSVVSSVVVDNKTGDTLIAILPKYKEYSYFDIEGKIKYTRFYDDEMNFLKEEGSPIVDIEYDYFSIIPNYMNSFGFLLATPPYSQYDFTIKVFKNNQLIEEKQLDIDFDYNKATFSIILSEDADFTIKGIYEIYNLQGELTRSHSLTVQLR